MGMKQSVSSQESDGPASRTHKNGRGDCKRVQIGGLNLADLKTKSARQTGLVARKWPARPVWRALFVKTRGGWLFGWRYCAYGRQHGIAAQRLVQRDEVGEAGELGVLQGALGAAAGFLRVEPGFQRRGPCAVTGFGAGFGALRLREGFLQLCGLLL